MKILTSWLRTYLPSLPLDLTDRQLADDLTLRGIAVEGVHDLGLGNGHLFEMDITTNRVDAMNHYGIARETATVYNLPLPSLDTSLPAPTTAAAFPVRIDQAAAELCGRFTARVLRDITIGPSTGMTKTCFDLLGQKQISNAVDASNATLLGMGHPTHAFDLDTIEGGLIIRLARAGERLRLLDGTERRLEADDLVIADHVKALSLAGVMGGMDSSITASTRNILIESAWFDPATIRRSARRHLLHTDASHRFERGADFDAAPIANHLVARLILEYGGRVEGDLVDLVSPEVAAHTSRRAPIPLSLAEVQRHLGTTLEDRDGQSALTAALVERYLSALGCTLQPVSAGGNLFSVTLPSWRLDLAREIDLIEEIARVHGYNRFANTLPKAQPVRPHPWAAPERAVRTRLLALGYSEAVSSTFASVPDSDLFALAPAAAVPMENPLSEEASNLRPSLVSGMLSMLALNLNRDVTAVRLFEQGQVFVAEDSTPTHVGDVIESPSLALGLTGDSPPTPLHSAADAPIFELKGAIESLVSLVAAPGGAQALTFTSESAPTWMEPGRGGVALLHGRPFARFGELSRVESLRRKLRQTVFLAEIDVAHLLALPLRKVTAHELSRFQAVERDFSFTFPDSIAWHTVAAAIHALSLLDLRSLAPIEIFRDPKGKAVAAGHYSLLLRTIFQSADRTLREEELTAWSARLIATLTELGGVLRS